MAQLRSTEKPELQMESPYAGILDSDFPSTQKGNYKGFSSALNIMFREGNASVRPGYTALPVTPNGHRVTGAFDFFNNAGVRVNAVATRDVFYRWDTATQAWVGLAGALTGSDGQYFSSTIVGQKLCFCQGVDKVQLWDGVGGAIAAAAAGAPIAKYLMELDNHLLCLNTIEGGNSFTQRVRWSGIGDPTDYVSFAAGATDLFNDQGPINGGIKLFQLGYIFQQWGITQATPTGIGTNPFAFQPILPSKGKGLFAPFSLSGFRTQLAPYVGKDNVYAFNGVDSESIGDHPIEGNRRIGARTQILSDLKQCIPTSIFGFTTTSINGHDFNAYWLFMFDVSVVWVYNFDEHNWTRFQFNKTVTVAQDFNSATPLRIVDLIGSIAQQSWFLNSPLTANPLDSMLIGFADGNVGSFDFTGVSESAWSLDGPQWTLGDGRHEKTLLGLRLIATDFGAVSATIAVISDTGDTESHVVSYGTGTGKQVILVIPFHITGSLFELSISGAAGVPFSVSEITPIYDPAKEIPNLSTVV